jgi:hypothetical protein
MTQKGTQSKETVSLEKFAKYVAGRVVKFMEVIRFRYLGVLQKTDVKDIPTRLRSSMLISATMMTTRVNAGSSRITTLLLTMSY